MGKGDSKKIAKAMRAMIEKIAIEYPTVADDELRCVLRRGRPRVVRIGPEWIRLVWDKEVAEVMASRVREVPRNDPAIEQQDHNANAQQRNEVLTSTLGRGWFTLAVIEAQTGILRGSVASRLRDLRIPKYGGWLVEKRRVKTGGPRLFEYRVSHGSRDEIDSDQRRMF